MSSTAIIQGMWVGPRLSKMEQLSICSFLANGHGYELYVYEDVAGMPRGVTVRDAGQILPPSMIFEYKDRKSHAGFGDFFRFKLLMEKGGWWADLDVICLKPFDFNAKYVFSSEHCIQSQRLPSGREKVNVGVIKAPPGDPSMTYAWEVCSSRDPKLIKWGEVGPQLMAEVVSRFSLEGYVHPAARFCPIPWSMWRTVVAPDQQWYFDDSTTAVHLWNDLWRRHEQDKNLDYPPECLYEVLKRKYLTARR